MTEHGWDTDEWPALLTRVLAADILVIAGPIWLGDNSSVTRRVIERLYGYSGVLNSRGQYAYHGRVGGCLLTYNLLHLASMIRRAGGFPAYGNQRTAWDAGSHPDDANPEYR